MIISSKRSPITCRIPPVMMRPKNVHIVVILTFAVTLIYLNFRGAKPRHIEQTASLSSPSISSTVAELPREPSVIKGNGEKWIVVTSVQHPTEDVQRLASLDEWTLVVVADKKTPANWTWPNVHFLSVEAQEALNLQSTSFTPYKSYTRKNIGHLYAISKGAKFIYDTDDDNKPFGLGVEQFDYVNVTSGMRFHAVNNNELSGLLFNPYLHFGRKDMWPRGFPLEHIDNHTHKYGSYRVCRKMKAAVVQQGIVANDPDMDAIYRILHTIPSRGLHEEFDRFAPPVTLAAGTFAPWNSQNTLFSYKAFFGLILPTSVAFRVTDIWRSFYTQALLREIGESVSFVPVNAIQQRNAHSYISDFGEEIDVYTKAGVIVSFLNEWRCVSDSLSNCMIELADLFVSRGFWGIEDAQLVRRWVADLKAIGYAFPPLQREGADEYLVSVDDDINAKVSIYDKAAERVENCRRAHFHAEKDLPEDVLSTPAIKRAEKLIEDFGDLKEWCGKTTSAKAQEWLMPNPMLLAERTLQQHERTQNLQTVAIITANKGWRKGAGMLQRLYEASFGHVILCGTHPTDDEQDDGIYPVPRSPHSFVNLSPVEMRGGDSKHLCITKVHEMRLQNVKGYYLFSDDYIFNVWHKMNLDEALINAKLYDARTPGHLWGNKIVITDASGTIDRMKKAMETDYELRRAIEQYKEGLSRNEDPVIRAGANDPFVHLLQMSGWMVSDWAYIPARHFPMLAAISQYAFLTNHEILFNKFADAIGGQIPEEQHMLHTYLWSVEDRANWTARYNSSNIGLHPIKLSTLASTTDSGRASFCDLIIDSFYQKLLA